MLFNVQQTLLRINYSFFVAISVMISVACEHFLRNLLSTASKLFSVSAWTTFLRILFIFFVNFYSVVCQEESFLSLQIVGLSPLFPRTLVSHSLLLSPSLFSLFRSEMLMAGISILSYADDSPCSAPFISPQALLSQHLNSPTRS